VLLNKKEPLYQTIKKGLIAQIRRRALREIPGFPIGLSAHGYTQSIRIISVIVQRLLIQVI